MPRWLPQVALLAALAACASATSGDGAGSDCVSLVQHAVRTETQRALSDDKGTPSYGNFYDDGKAPAAKFYDDGKAPAAAKFYDDGKAPAAAKFYDDGKAPAAKFYDDGKAPAAKFYDDGKAPAGKFYDDGKAPAGKFYDDGKAPAGKALAPAFYDDGKGPAQAAPAPKLFDDGKAPATSSAGDGKASAGKPDGGQVALPLPEYKAGERAEIISMQGANIGTWNFCKVLGKGEAPGTYKIYLPQAPEGQRVIPGVDGKYLRKDKPDAASKAIADQAEKLAAQLKAQSQIRLSPEQQKQAEIAKWMMDKGLVPGAKTGHGPNLLEEIGSSKMNAITKLLNNFYQNQPPPPPMLSAQEEMQHWLDKSGAALSKDDFMKLHAKANQLSKERPVLEEAIQLKAVSPATAARVRTKEEELEELANDPVINGTWDLGSGGRVFSIHNASCSLFVEGKLAGKGQLLVGAMRQEGEWFVSNLTNLSAYPSGTIRVQRGEETGTAVVSFRNTEAQRDFGQLDWSGGVVARRTARTSDPMPGKCNFQSYGCRCHNGRLKQPDIFGGHVGDEVEVFKEDGSGWFRCTILGYNQTTMKYTIFVPEGPVNQRVIPEIASEWLRHPPAPPPAPKKEQLELPAARADLQLKASLPQQRAPARQEEQTPMTARQPEWTSETERQQEPAPQQIPASLERAAQSRAPPHSCLGVSLSVAALLVALHQA